MISTTPHTAHLSERITIPTGLHVSINYDSLLDNYVFMCKVGHNYNYTEIAAGEIDSRNLNEVVMELVDSMAAR